MSSYKHLHGYYKREREKKISRCWWLRPAILATWEAEIPRIAVQGQPRKISKITRAKWPGVTVQAVEYLLCKCKVVMY
jgi:hypothetical protein